jgi:nitrogen fixation NifU-like protein
MTKTSDDLFKELEQSVTEDMKKAYSEKTIDHFLNPRNLGEILGADGLGRVTGSCGDTMEIYLKVKDSKIVNVSFWTDGCGPSIASGSMVTELVKGMSIADAEKITDQDLLGALGGLPADSIHCASLAADSLKEAIKHCLASKSEPRRKDYHR